MREKEEFENKIKAIRNPELSDIPTSRLVKELSSRMDKFDRLEKSHSKLFAQHKKAAVFVAELKK